MNKKWMKAFGVLSTTALLTGVLAACSEGDSASEGGKPELTIATWANEDEAKEFDAILNEINEEQDNYTIKQMIIPKDYYTKVQTMIAGNNAPDLMWLAQEYVPAYAKNGAIVELTDRVAEEDAIDMSDYYEGALNTAKYEDGVFGLPWIAQPYVVYYNKSMFEANGLKDPKYDWNWNEFKQTAKALTKDGNYGFASTGNPPSAVFAWGEGGELLDQDGTIRVTEAETVKGLEVMKSITTDPAISMPFSEASSLGVEQGFINGKIGMMIGGANDDVERKVKESGAPFDVGMAVMPAGSKEQVTFSWIASTVIAEQTKDKDVAYDALVDVTNKIFEWKVPSPMKSKIGDIGDINPNKAYAVDVIEKSAAIARGFNNLPEQNELGAMQWEHLDLPILSNNNGKGDVDIEAVVKKTEESMSRVLK